MTTTSLHGSGRVHLDLDPGKDKLCRCRMFTQAHRDYLMIRARIDDLS